VQSLARRLEKGGVLSCAGISETAQPFLAALLRYLFPKRPIVAVAEGLKTQESFQQDLATWLGIQPLFYPAWEILPHDDRLPHVDVISERLETLVALSRDDSTNSHEPSPMVVTSVVALLQRTFPRALLTEQTRSLARADRIDPLDLVEWLEERGYEPEAQVTQKGELSLRGGILDVYPPTQPWPLRLEFFGDELESLRYFDPLTQISREEISSAILPPAGELGLLKKRQIPDSPAHNLGTLVDYLPKETIFLICAPEQVEARAQEYAKQISGEDPFFIAWDDFQAHAAGQQMTLLCVAESAEAPLEGAAKWEVRGARCKVRSGRAEGGGAQADPEPVGAESRASGERGSRDSDAEGPRFDSLDAFRPLTERPPEPPVAEAQRREFFAQLHRWSRQGYDVRVFCNNEGERQRFTEIWKEYGLESPKSKVQSPKSGDRGQRTEDGGRRTEDGGQGQEVRKQNVESSPSSVAALRRGEKQKAEIGMLHSAHRTPHSIGAGGLCIHVGTLARGFLNEEGKLVVVTDAEIFGRYKVQRPRRLKSAHAQAIRSALDIDFSDLEEGDYVVHLQHGIGRYLGLQVLPLGAGARQTEGSDVGATSGQECLVIEYAPGNLDEAPPKLYVPVTEAHLVSKYVGTGKARPPLNTLGGTRWAKAKEHAERAVRDVASDLLAIQAARESQPGHAFAPDAPWQREFEGAFIYEETPDQMTAIHETKADMERPKPMDRLICGDVGFGKTEVGIRAAFKAVMDGKQVAVLVPTTVLAQQHFNTFRERMADYPVRIELLSRFRTRRAQGRVVTDLAAGSVDIVIGTHRLLQADISFKDLGLVVIDEEQRFGVMHKEKFKMLRRLVDVLTLSATPIPRTLYLALTGARDMSTIQTPPHDRLPVETIVTQYDERIIRDAIQRELNRGGQVFFLHNRVMTIEAMAQKLRHLVPDARIVVGHGQMHSDDLEEVMTKFVNGEADVLLSTTIIESGLDIPNANTILIDRADRFGLSDLYQLRGRVGRYKHQAYAYLLLPRHAGLLADVRKRLSAIKQYSTLGSGFKIAMRDLEIRGAGNLLGAEQSGHITAVGFELYCQLLKQSISGLQGQQVKPRVEVAVRLDFLALTPTDERRQAIEVHPRSIGSMIPDTSHGGRRTEDGERRTENGGRRTEHALHSQPSPLNSQPSSAYIPFNYISDARQRIEIYRKLAQASEKAGLDELQRELRDRFGPVPPALGLLLQVGELKILAAERAITTIEVKEDKLMLTRNQDFVMVGSKFPRLSQQDASARLKEIKKFLLAL
jgi:transcription-repair coupling factor (superfamily II helicase)